MGLPGFLIFLALLFQPVVEPPLAHKPTGRFSETRKLLLEMERDARSQALKRLFEEGEERMPDLIQALYDPEKKVNLNAQVVIRYLADSGGMTALEKWYESRWQQGKEYWMPKIEPLPDDSEESKFLATSRFGLSSSSGLGTLTFLLSCLAKMDKVEAKSSILQKASPGATLASHYGLPRHEVLVSKEGNYSSCSH